MSDIYELANQMSISDKKVCACLVAITDKYTAGKAPSIETLKSEFFEYVNNNPLDKIEFLRAWKDIAECLNQRVAFGILKL